jgi:lipopolysaccharide transport system ATP-binding protein
MDTRSASILANDIVLSVRNLGKQYRLFDDPQDRLKHMLLWRLGKTYGHPFDAVQDVSFDLHRGEMLAIIGKNGSGKSTLLQMIAGTLTPTQGNILCDARIGALLELGSGFNPEYSGRENIKLNASILGISSSELNGKIQAIIDFADIGEFIDQPVKLYSSGMFVRLAFAVTTGLESDIILIDEALAVGDVFFRQKCYQRLEEMRKKGVSIILVTHSMGDVEQFCQRAILLRNGENVFQGQAIEAVKWYYLEDQPIDKNNKDQSFGEVKEIHSPGATFSKKVEEWPSAASRFDIHSQNEISNGGAHCVLIALCDSLGNPARCFQQFIYDFKLEEDIEIPNGGIVLHNEKGWTVHGKGTLLYGTQVPLSVAKNSTIRIVQKVKLDLEAGEYTFEVALNTMTKQHYLLKSTFSPSELYSKVQRICFVPSVGPFVIVHKPSGIPVSLTHHGIANLPGSAVMTLIDSQ